MAGNFPRPQTVAHTNPLFILLPGNRCFLFTRFKVGHLLCRVFVFKDQCFYMKLEGGDVCEAILSTNISQFIGKGILCREEMIKFFALIAHTV